MDRMEIRAELKFDYMANTAKLKLKTTDRCPMLTVGDYVGYWMKYNSQPTPYRVEYIETLGDVTIYRLRSTIAYKGSPAAPMPSGDLSVIIKETDNFPEVEIMG